MPTDVTTKDPKGTVPAFTAARELLGAVSPRFRKVAAKAVARRLNEFAKMLTKDGVVANAKAAKSSVSVAAAKPGKAKIVARSVKATKASTPTRTLSPTRAVPKGSLTKNGKKRGRPFSKNVPVTQPDEPTTVEYVYAHPDGEMQSEHAAD